MPAMHITAAILSIGDELTLGQGLDTNSQWLSQRLVAMGIVPVEHSTVPDDLNAIAGAMARLAGGSDVVICTGGLGPTADDLTRQGLARATGQELVEDAAAVEQIRAWFAGRERQMPEANRAQAGRPASAEMLTNEFGTAPGLFALLRAGTREVEVFCLPGPPREMRPMFETRVAPRLRPGRTVKTRAILTFGLGESEVAERLGELMARTHMPVVGTTVKAGVVAVRIRHEGAREGAAMQEVEDFVRGQIGPYVFGADADTLASVCLGLLKSRSETLAVVESCTGGLVGALLTEVPGSSVAFVGGWITYSNDLKMRQVGVPAAVIEKSGAVSRECAEAMALGGLERSGGAWCISVTGIAGPDGGSREKPVGTVWIAIARGDRGASAAIADARQFRFSGERQHVRDWAAASALAMLRFKLAGIEGVRMLREVHPPKP